MIERKRLGRWFLRWVGFVVLFVILDRISDVHHFGGLPVTPWNPNSGLALAYLLYFGPGHGVAVLFAAFISDLLIRDMPLAASIPMALVYAGSYVAAAVLLRRIRGLSLLFETPRDMMAFLAIVAVTISVATFLRIVFATGSAEVGSDGFMTIFGRLWVGDTVGTVVFTPLVLHLAIRGKRYLVRTTGERLLQIALAAMVTFIVFGLESTNEFKFFYLLFPPVMWVALRGGLFQTVAVVALIQCGVILATTLRGFPDAAVTEFQMLVLTLAVTGLLMAATAGTRQRAEAALHARLIELSRLSRIHATAEVAAGLAHELKQPMLAVLNYVGAARRLLERTPPSLDEAIGHIHSAEAQVMRADETLRRIRTFVQKGETLAVPLALTVPVREAVEMVAPLARRHGVRIEAVLDTGLPPVMADHIQVLQIMVNLLTNAIHAMVEGNAPLRLVHVGAWVQPNWEVRITVSDTGPGLSEEIVNELFQPFVTGRTQGIGIGLSICRAMAEALGGDLWHDPPAPNRGATFHLTLPIARDSTG